MFFQLQNKEARLNRLECKKEKGALVQFIAVSLLTSDSVYSFLEVATISYQT